MSNYNNNLILTNERHNILSISELNRLSKTLLEQQIGQIWLKGEISNLARPSSGHFYFTLKDDKAQVRCALFRGTRTAIDFTLENGQAVLAEARVSLYEARGEYQLIIHSMQLAGDGTLQIKFEKLKKKLLKEGLFATDHKTALPRVPNTIGVVTSATGAAIHDVLTVLARRNHLANIIIYPTAVQGQIATQQIIASIHNANQRQECDLLLLVRGGGSLEDLWCFNEEAVARCIYNSKLPIITGIGHEVDITIADLVADHRAATPSAAAEIASRDQMEWRQLLFSQWQQLRYSMDLLLQKKNQALIHSQQRLRHPHEQIQIYAQQLDQLESRLVDRMQTILKLKQAELNTLAGSIHNLSPLKTLARGYSLTYNASQQLISSCQDIKVDDTIKIVYQDGQATAQIKAIDKN